MFYEKSQRGDSLMGIDIGKSNQRIYSSVSNNVTNNHQNDDFYFQWHITDKCNLRCSHCYQDDYSYSSELSLEELKSIADKINHTLTVWKKDGRVAITGGEPFVKKDIINLLHYLNRQSSIKKIGILTNGTLLKNHVDSLKDINKLYYIQMSLEGRKEKNDEIRGNGVFDKVIESSKYLKNEGIPVRWMVTLHKNNINEIPYIIDLAININVDVITFERLIPTGTGKSMKDMLLAPSDLSKVYEYILKRSDEEYSKGSSLTILKLRTLWILMDPKRSEKNMQTPFRKEVGAACSIGMDSICILPDATVLPCRRLPIPIGNLKNDSIFNIWYTSKLLWEIRNKNNLKGKCNGCELISRCSGCRAMAYAVTGDYLEEDPQCWK